jgi:FkbM family methyltransferase
MVRQAALTLVNKLARSLGAEQLIPNIVHSGRDSSMPRWDERVLHAKKLGFTVTSCLDVGAFAGTWTKSIADIFPGCKVIAIEPNPHIQEELKRNLSVITPSPRILQMAVAEKPGQMNFNIWGDPLNATSASLQDHVRGDAENKVTVAVDTLDNIVTKYNVTPELVKLDLQGAELRALNGASTLLKSVEMFLVEFGCLNAYVDRATPRQLLDLFYDNDYCLYDIVECHYRPYDGALTGGDFIFVKNSSQLRSYKNWD